MEGKGNNSTRRFGAKEPFQPEGSGQRYHFIQKVGGKGNISTSRLGAKVHFNQQVEGKGDIYTCMRGKVTTVNCLMIRFNNLMFWFF